METKSNLIRKVIYVFEKDANSTSQSHVSISIPEPVDDINGDHYCYVEFERQLSAPVRLVGVDPFQVTLIAIQFLERLLSATYNDFEIRDVGGNKYATPFPI